MLGRSYRQKEVITRVTGSARGVQDGAARRLGTLDALSRRLGESLDLERAVRALTGVLVPEIADLCAVYELKDPDQLTTLRIVTADPALAATASLLLQTKRRVLQGGPVRAVLDSGESMLIEGLTSEDLERFSLSEPERELFARLQPHSVLALPLRSRGGIRELVLLFAAQDRPPWTPADLAYARDAAERSGPAIDNARLYANAVEAQARFLAAFDSAPIGMALVEADNEGSGTIEEANPALCELLGYSREELLTRDLAALQHPEDRELARESAAWLMSGQVAGYGGERRYVRKDGRTVWLQVHVGRVGERQVVLQAQDVTERRRHQGQLQFLADHDSLTGLYNRRRFAEELDWVVAYVRRYRVPAAILVVDVDDLKFVNDTYGHAVGDELLVAIADTLRSRCRETDIAGRLGGDEFGVILPQSTREEAAAVAGSLIAAVREGAAAEVGSRTVLATISAGVRLIDPDGKETTDELLSDADMALYDAKEGGKDRLSLAGAQSPATDRMRARLNWSERIKAALLDDGFALFEQPILSVASGRIDGSELLLRMRTQTGDMIAPGAFLEIAERFGQIQAIDCWVIARAIRLLADRQAAGIDLKMEVNLSGGSVTDPTVLDFICSEVRNAPIDPSRLIFEITETAAIVNIEQARKLAMELSELGCRLALDDFGSGFGSFYYLKHLPFDVIKIDGEFVKDLPGSRTDQLTVQAIVQIARGLGKPTVAEYVENAATLGLLERFGVDHAQGYHIGRPRPATPRPEFMIGVPP